MNRLMVYLDAIRDHLDLHQLPPVALLRVGVRSNPVSVQLDVDGLAEVARALLVWAGSLDEVTASIWRAPGSGSVHLEVYGRTPCGIPVEVYGYVEFDADVFPDMPAEVRQDLPLFVLRQWDTTGEVAA